jgi:SsrA-binding protein
MAKKKPERKRITNKRASHDYFLDDSLLAGIMLTGAETKSLRMGHGHLQGAYVTEKGGALWLINATINGAQGIPISEEDQTRTRKLLLKKSEIEKLLVGKKQGNTIIPIEIIPVGRYIKVRIALGKGKKNYDKRQTLKARDESRQINRALKTS